MESELVDRLHRPVRDLRLSVTDRCNFRCPYCMPRVTFGPQHAFSPRADLLSFEELTRVVTVFAGLGVTKVRLTGGEPLLRRDLEALVAMIAVVPGIDDIAMTTNGSLLADRADRLREAGLGRVTISLDSVDPDTFGAMSDARVPLEDVLAGIAAAKAADLGPVKLNAVIQRGVNDDGVLALAEFARAEGLVVRFIEYMDVGSSNGWVQDQVVPAADIVAEISGVHPLDPVEPSAPGEVARRWRYVDGGGEIGVVTSVTEPFCGDCTRARVTAVGELFTCLFATRGRDLRGVMRSGGSDADLRDLIGEVWSRRSDRYSELRTAETAGLPRPEMSYLGG
jgi:cyclic pyranopterin phosphate synthase